MGRLPTTGEEGQVFPALLLVVVVLVSLGFAVVQLGSAGDQKTQTQTAADAGALAAAEALAADVLLGGLTPVLDITGSYASPSTAAYSAAQRAWGVNRPSRSLFPGDVFTERVGIATVRVTVTAPAGVIVDGPVPGTDEKRPVATATATLSARCEGVRSVVNGALNLLRDRLRLSGPACAEPLPTTTTSTLAPNPPLPPPLVPVSAPVPVVIRIPLATVLDLVRPEIVA